MFDVLKRFLLYQGKDVIHIQNVTDVDDKIIKRAKENNVDPINMAHEYNKEALELFDKLNILRADFYPKVTENINYIIDFIKGLINKGYAYQTPTGVYFSIEKFKDYGKLSDQSIEELKKHRIEPDETKRNSADFALWKISEEKPNWDSPWGRGRPGWHIECSVMALRYAKTTLTIHGGGRDLIFPHHENEIAQSEALTGKKFSYCWVHTGSLTVNGVKMSKSLNNFITLKDALKEYTPEVLRAFFLSASINSPLDFKKESMENARNNIKEISESYKTLLTAEQEFDKNKNENNEKNRELRNKINKLRKQFFKSLENNLNTPLALSNFYEFIKIINANVKDLNKDNIELSKLFFQEFSFITGIKLETAYTTSNKEKQLLDIIINTRKKLREKGIYELSDKIREMLAEINIDIYDEGKETKIRYL
jgi:cysteinyl-tRNA synthetase